MRKCVVSQEQLPKKELLRIVKTVDGSVCVDLSGKMNGRGAYIKKDEEVLKVAMKKGSLAKSLETSISDDVYEKILEVIRG